MSDTARTPLPEDRVFIRDLRIDTIIGVHTWERQVRQSLYLDIDMAWDQRRAAQTDDLQFALNYQAVAECVIQLAQGRDYQLIETLAEDCAQAILQAFTVPWVRLSVKKPGALMQAGTLGVTIERRGDARD